MALPDSPAHPFGDAIRTARRDARLTQKELGELAVLVGSEPLLGVPRDPGAAAEPGQNHDRQDQGHAGCKGSTPRGAGVRHARISRSRMRPGAD